MVYSKKEVKEVRTSKHYTLNDLIIKFNGNKNKSNKNKNKEKEQK